MNKNKLSGLIKWIGYIGIILSIIAGFVMGKPEDEYLKYQWSLAIQIVLSGVVGGIIMLGFAEVIQLLQDIKDKSSMYDRDKIDRLEKLVENTSKS